MEGINTLGRKTNETTYRGGARMRRKEEGEEAMDDERAMEVGPRIAAARRKEGLAVRWDENVTMHIYVEMYLNSRLSGEFRAVI